MTIAIDKPESVGFCSSRLARIDQVMQEIVETGSKPVGISTLIARRNKVVHRGQYGFMDRETQHPMQPDTLFRLYSMTKPIVCTAFMTLYERGKVDLKEPVSKYIPAFANLKVLAPGSDTVDNVVDLAQPVTIHHLLTHTSGLTYDFYEDSPVCQLYRDQRVLADAAGCTLEAFVDKLTQLPLAFQPGSRWCYSVAIDVIGRLIEIISQQSLKDFVQETILDPLGMADTGFFLPEEKRHRVATMYGGVDLCAQGVNWSQLVDVWERGVNKRLDVTQTSPIDKPNFMRGGTGLTGSMDDYWRFTQMLLNKGIYDGKRILAPTTVAFMHMNHLKLEMLPIGFADWKLTGFGFGLGSRVLMNVADSEIVGSKGEYGWAGAAKTYYWIDPKEELIGLFFTQSMCDFSMIERSFQALTYQALVE